VWSQIDDTGYPPKYIAQDNHFFTESIALAQGHYWWFNLTTVQTYQFFADKLSQSRQKTSEQFGVIGLRALEQDENTTWHGHQQPGVYQIK
jgi:hypothetical protein